MASWTVAGSIYEGTLRCVRDDPLHPTASRNGSEKDSSQLEINGLNSCIIVHFSSAGICLDRTRLIFPTLYADPRNFRGYLSAPLSIPAFLQNQRSSTPTETSYDGISLKLVYPALNISVFVSPGKPTVWVVFEKEDTSPLSFPSTASKEIITEANGNTLYCYSNRITPSRYTVAYSCCAESPGSSFDDYQARKGLVASWTKRLVFIHPNPNLTAAMYFAKIRTQEAIFAAKRLGKVHSPGGGMFYGGVWCNDQAEYAAPIFPLLHDPLALLNSLRVLANHFDEEHLVPYSIEIDGGYVGKLDRGDAAMYARGTSLMVLALNRPEVTAEFWKHIQFCINSILDKIYNNAHGILPSQSDELEGRYPSGDANLSVNCLAVLALDSAAEVAMLLPSDRWGNCVEMYRQAADRLRSDVHNHFRVEGPERYAYFKGCDDPRGWICLAALAGLPDGTEALRYALEKLWVPKDGVRTSSLSSDVWDRCTLYAIQAAFQKESLAGLATKKLTEFVQNRFSSGIAAPYAVENSTSCAQLSAESALLLRTVTEGLLGMSFRGDECLHMHPKCPGDWNQYQILKIPFGTLLFDVSVEKVGKEHLLIQLNYDESKKEITLKCGYGFRVEKQGEPLNLTLRPITT